MAILELMMILETGKQSVEMDYYYLDKSGHEIGPLASDTLAKFRSAGVLDAETSVRAADSAEWKPFRDIIADAPAAPAPAPQPVAPGSGVSGVWRNKWVFFVMAALAVVLLVRHALMSPPSGAPLAGDGQRAVQNPIKAEFDGRTKLRQGLRMRMDYKNSRESELESSAFSSIVYIFGDQGVSVYKEVSAKGDICRKNSDGSLQSSSDRWDIRVGAAKGSSLIKGTDEETHMEVLFGPGDRMPVLENAPYKVEGSSVWVDWSQGHSRYFPLSRANSDAEVFTIKNDGLVLESATSPGLTLTLSMGANSAQPALH